MSESQQKHNHSDVESHQPEPPRQRRWYDSFRSLLVAVLIALLLRSFVVEAFKIPSGSMIPTLSIGDQIFVNKYIYGPRIPFTTHRLMQFKHPERGEVTVFVNPQEPHEDYIKRVIGVGGDIISMRDGIVSVNGKQVSTKILKPATYWDRDNKTDQWSQDNAIAYQETLNNHTYLVYHETRPIPMMLNFEAIKVPAGHLFVMGDNRDHSYDSRFWGTVPEENVLGRALFVWWSWGQHGLDYKRIGTQID